MTIHEILSSPNRAYAQCSDPSIEGILEYGFSYVENQDNMVRYIVAGPAIIKRILTEIKDAELDVEGERVGRVWTADLFFSKKLNERRIVFSNEPMDTVLVLDIIK